MTLHDIAPDAEHKQIKKRLYELCGAYYDDTRVDERIDELLALFDAARAQPVEQRAVADGWQLVPKHPTDTMIAEAVHAQPEAGYISMREAYDALLAAAPTPAADSAKKEMAAVVIDYLERMAEAAESLSDGANTQLLRVAIKDLPRMFRVWEADRVAIGKEKS